jgi:hypothetical protein
LIHPPIHPPTQQLPSLPTHGREGYRDECHKEVEKSAIGFRGRDSALPAGDIRGKFVEELTSELNRED